MTALSQWHNDSTSTQCPHPIQPLTTEQYSYNLALHGNKSTISLTITKNLQNWQFDQEGQTAFQFSYWAGCVLTLMGDTRVNFHQLDRLKAAANIVNVNNVIYQLDRFLVGLQGNKEEYKTLERNSFPLPNSIKQQFAISINHRPYFSYIYKSNHIFLEKFGIQ